MQFLSKDRQNYYKSKKAEITRKNQESKVVKDDAMFIRYYGMSAYLELFPEAKDFGVSWHREVVKELVKLEKRNMASFLSGNNMAISAIFSKKAARKFKRVIKGMIK